MVWTPGPQPVVRGQGCTATALHTEHCCVYSQFSQGCALCQFRRQLSIHLGARQMSAVATNPPGAASTTMQRQVCPVRLSLKVRGFRLGGHVNCWLPAQVSAKQHGVELLPTLQ